MERLLLWQSSNVKHLNVTCDLHSSNMMYSVLHECKPDVKLNS